MVDSDRSYVTLRTDAVEVRWSDGSVTTLPNLWLRDNCDCTECLLPQTNEKTFLVASVATDLRPADVTLRDDELRVTWPDGHLSCYMAADISTVDSATESGWSPWRDDFRPQKIDYQSFLDDDQIAIAAIAGFLRDGVFIIESAPVLPGTLEDLAPRLGPVREVLFDRIHDVEVYPEGYNVAHTSLALPPHNDFPSYSWPPSVQALHMLVNETPGGESTIVDGWQLLRRFRQEHPVFFETLCTTPVAFRQFDADNETYAIAPLVRCDTDGEIVQLRFSNQLMQRINPVKPGVTLFYKAYHELCRRVLDPATLVTFRLHAGEILLLAGHRVLHGRNKFEPVARRHLQDAYYELDNVRGHLVVLQRNSGG